MEPLARRQIGGHYTSERDILKVIRALFLDDLRDEFERAKRSKAELKRLHQKIAKLRFLDPACGCGNFLVISYRELRVLEIEILKLLFKGQRELNIDGLSEIDVDAFHGIEILEWPARIAEVAMWLMDHQMNQQLSEAFGQYFVRLPLRKSPHIVCGNALRLDWKEILPPGKCSYILGNPPFVGKQFASTEQKQDMKLVCGQIKGGGVLDYVTGWYIKAAEYLNGTKIVAGFVSTNSISQGEQVGILWNELFTRYHMKIHFAHRTFAWESEARGKAHVHVVIIGFGAYDGANKRIYDYEGDNATVIPCKNISPYLVDGSDVVVLARSTPISAVPEIVFGNMPNDGGHLILTDEQKAALLKQYPDAKKFIRLFLGAQEFINGEQRWCLWLKGATSAEIRSSPEIFDRVERVREHRKKSSRQTTKELAATPTLFGEIRQPDGKYLAIPKTSSERRTYIPIAFLQPDTITNTELFMMENATPFHFGILSSTMHMAWVRQVCGRLESRYRYSNKMVYNNFPWPSSISQKQEQAVETLARRILSLRVEMGDGRAGYLPQRKSNGRATLAELYDPVTAPPMLVKAHADLDRAVDRCYRAQPFTNERQRVEFLFALYEKITTPLVAAPRSPSRRTPTFEK